MTVKVTREAEPQIELYGAYSGQLDGTGRVSLTFVAADTYLIMVPKNAVSRPQLELGAFATSYIPTAASTVTRNADVATVGVGQFPYSAMEGTLVINADIMGTGNAALFSLDDGTSSNRVYAVAGTTGVNGVIVASNSTVFNAVVSETITQNVAFKSGIAYALDNANMATNGTVSTDDTSAALPNGASTLRIGRSVGGVYVNGHIRQITYIPRRLTNAELQSRTA